MKHVSVKEITFMDGLGNLKLNNVPKIRKGGLAPWVADP
jgi:hypothetical protein